MMTLHYRMGWVLAVALLGTSGCADAESTLGGLGLSSQNEPGSQIPEDALEDFLFQDVCIDESGEPNARDPYSCWLNGHTVRDHAPDEALFYLRQDRADLQTTGIFSLALSVPLSLPDGATRALNIIDFGGDRSHAFFQKDHRSEWTTQLTDDDVQLDGYDVFEVSGMRVMQTSHLGPGGEVTVHDEDNTSCEGTPLFDASRIFRGQATNKVVDIAGDGCLDEELLDPLSRGVPFANLASHLSASGRSFVSWRAIWFNFDAGKSMETLISEHFNAESAAEAESFVRTYFTREYGRTRLEYWSRASAPTTTGCASTETAYSPLPDSPEGFNLQHCRDWSYVRPQVGLMTEATTADANIAATYTQWFRGGSESEAAPQVPEQNSLAQPAPTQTSQPDMAPSEAERPARDYLQRP